MEGYDNVRLLPGNALMLDRIHTLTGNKNTVLDAGCGTGNLTVKLAENNMVTAIDFSDGMIEYTKKKVSNEVLVKKGDVTNLEFDDNSFDAVTSVNVLFNLESPIDFIKEAHRVLKDGGKIVISSLLKDRGLSKELINGVLEDCKNNEISEDKIQSLLKYNKILFRENGIKYAPTMNEIKILLETNGFKVQWQEEVYYKSNFLIMAIKIKT